jgi:dipeptidyl aminopeptidase/acylaminoacyl peptidase
MNQMSKALRFACIGWLLPVLLFSQPDGKVISTSNVVLPPYEEVPDISKYYDLQDYKDSRLDSTLIIERIVYASDGLKVVSFLARQAGSKDLHRRPVVVFNRGSYIRNDIAYVHAPLFKMFVDNGFIVIAPAVRGSEGGEGNDKMGGDDLHDIWNILPILTAMPDVDLNNLFLLGESRGAMMSLQALRDGFPARATAIVGVISDLEQYVQDNPDLEPFARQIWPDLDENRAAIARKRSVIHWADDIQVPLLIMAGGNDEAVDPGQSIGLAAALNKLNKEYQLLILNGGNHVLSGEHTERRDTEILDWFRRWME